MSTTLFVDASTAVDDGDSDTHKDSRNAEPCEQITEPRIDRPDAAARDLRHHRAVPRGEVVGDSQPSSPRVDRSREPGCRRPDERHAVLDLGVEGAATQSKHKARANKPDQ
jgi:hypothetical protein